MRTCGLHHLETDAHTHVDSRLSCLATKLLSVIVAPGPSSLEAQEVKVVISLTIPECCVVICHCIFFYLLFICVHCAKMQLEN